MSSVMRRLTIARGTLLNSRKKFSVVWRAISSARDAARLGQHLGGLDDIGRLVALAADMCRARDTARRSRPGCGRPAATRRCRAGRLRILEGQDAGERDVAGRARWRGGRGRAPPVKQCSTAGKAPFPVSSSRIARHVVVGLARMDHQRQAGLARGGDVGAEALLLRVARAVVVVIVEPGLADRHHLGMRASARPDRRCRCRVPRAAWCGCVPTEQNTSSEIARRSRADPACLRTRVEIVTMRPMPAARARATTPSSSSAKSGKSRWQWLSTSMVTSASLARAWRGSGST